MKKTEISQTINTVYNKIREVLETARSYAYKSVNFAMVQAYWNIGRIIVEEEQKGKIRADYGKAVLEDSSKRLSDDFGKGFSVQSLWNMRQFYLVFKNLSAPQRESLPMQRLGSDSNVANLREKIFFSFTVCECFQDLK